MKKIAIVQPILAPYSIPRFEELAKYKDIELHLLFEKEQMDHRKGWKVKEIDGCRIHILDSIIRNEKSINKDTKYITNGIRAIPYKLPKLLTKIKPDVLIVCNATQLIFGSILKKILKYKIGIIVEDTNNSEKNRKWLNKKLKKMILKFSDFYLPYSNDAITYLNDKKIYKNIYRTSWSIDIDKFDEISVKKKKNEKIKMISVARLVEGKGIDKLLKAYSMLKDNYKENIELKIIGDGPEINNLKEFVLKEKLNNVKLLGQMDYEDVILEMSKSDIFILPTLGDLFSLVVMEAMATGLPVLTTSYNGAKELIKEDSNGYIFDPYDIEDIKNTIEKVYINKDSLYKMGEKSKYIIKDYSHKNVMKRLHSILKEI